MASVDVKHHVDLLTACHMLQVGTAIQFASWDASSGELACVSQAGHHGPIIFIVSHCA